MSVEEAVQAAMPRRRVARAAWFAATVTTIMLLLFGVPWWTLLLAGNQWPPAIVTGGTVLIAAALVTFPPLMMAGHGRRHRDWAARVADTELGVVWVLFSWALLGNLLRVVLLLAGVADPLRSRLVSVAVVAVALVLLGWGYAEAMRVPRVRRVDVRLDRLGPALDGLRVVLITDTHYGPIDRARWSAGVTEVINSLDPDVVAHTGDIADGEVAARRAQAAPLGDVRASLARVYVTGNHEYFSGAQRWVEHMATLGWEALHNRHIVVERGADRLVIAGVDDRTAGGSGVPGHHADHTAALTGTDPALPVLLLAHQPQQIGGAVAHGVDLQLSGHTHGGQIWPFHYLVRTDQPVLQGLSQHGPRTQLYTSRGTGFWGPPFRVFAPSEITLITLRQA
ncbi:metallophosphoesterase [Krasilnikovia sp. MM14-A1004]|uniref:metallophosphoesterase n=1 Tax=Krasilnikovia sp. MM14-A1004 TaxID=3373541 RepID=UPI00399C7CE1